MSVYLDTSVIVAMLIRESRSTAVRVWLGAQAPRSLLISDWVVTEFSSALSIKLRTGQITSEIRAGALRRFTLYASETFRTVGLGREHFLIAASYANRHELGLRAGDALHLALTSSQSATLCTLDKRMMQAAQALGIDVSSVPSAV